jgi:hypothetical protein
MAEVYPFTENNDHEIFNYKQFANIISSTRQQNNYDHRFTQVNSFGRAATNCVSNLYQMNAVPTITSYERVDILLKPCLINTYLAQSIITGYKLQSGYMDHIYKLYQNEPFAVPAEIIYNDNFGKYPHGNGIDTTKQFKFTHVKEVCVLFPRHVSDYTVQFNSCLDKLCISMFNYDYFDKEINIVFARFLRSQLEAMGLDTILQATESLEQSYISPHLINIQLMIDQFLTIQILYLFFLFKENLQMLSFSMD